MMNDRGISLDILTIAGCVLLLIFTLFSRNKRARWAKALLIASCLVGVVFHAVDLALLCHRLVLSRFASHQFLGGITFGVVDWLAKLTAVASSGEGGQKKPGQIGPDRG